MKKVRPRRSRPIVAGAAFFFLVVAYAAFSCCTALSLPPRFFHNAGRGSNLGGGGKSPPPWHHFCHDGGDKNDQPSTFNVASCWILSSSSHDEDGGHVPSITDDQSTQDVTVLRMRGGDVAVIQKTSSSSNKNIADSINDALDSLQKVMIRPFQMVGQHIPPSLLNKKKGDTSSAKDQEQVLRSTKILSVTAPESDLLPPDVITKSAADAELVGGTLNPEALELTATAINRWYADNGYVLNSVTGATLIPFATDDDSNDESSTEGRVELKVKEVKVAKTSQNSSFPVTLRLVQRVESDSGTNDPSSLFSIPSQSGEAPALFKSISGCTRPKKIARMTKLEPGSHLRILPDRWSRLVAFPGGIFGAGGGRSAIFSNIHAVRPIPEESSQGDTVSVEIIATENKPYAALEYGVTKSLYSDKWEGEFDLKHTNAFGGGEVATVNVRKGQSYGRKNSRNNGDDENNKWAQRLNGGPLSWRMSVKDSYAGYDLDLFHENVGVGRRRKKHQSTSNKEAEIGALSEESGGNPMRVGGTMRVRLPSSMKRKFKANAVSATFERIHAQSIASASVGVGPYKFNPIRSLYSSFSASFTSGVRSNSDGKSGAGVVPYAAGTLTSHQIIPSNSSPVTLAVRHVASGGTKNLPRHEAISLGLSSKVRGYKYNYGSQKIDSSSVEEEQQEQGAWQALKKLCSGGKGAKVSPQIAVSKALSGTMELRVPFQATSEGGLQPILSGTFLLFGDWSLTQAHNPSVATEKENRPSRFSSVGVGLRKVVQGIPLKVDACVTEHGSKGIFFGIGGQEF
eukprot:scaffold11586_cov155-Skeletonema_menzelii.AAC.2